jgi:hypothetical protein
MSTIFTEADPAKLKIGDRIKETEDGLLMVIKTVEVHYKTVEDPRAATSDDLTVPEYISISYHFASEPETSVYSLRCNPQWRCLLEDEREEWQITALNFFEGKTTSDIENAEIPGIGEATAQRISSLDPLNWDTLSEILTKNQQQQIQKFFST